MSRIGNVIQAMNTVEKWMRHSNKGFKSYAIDEIYRLDEKLETGEFQYVDSLLSAVVEQFPKLDISVCLSLLTVTAPWVSQLGSDRGLLYTKTHNALMVKYNESYADIAMVGLAR